MSADPVEQFRARLEEANEDRAEAWDTLDPDVKRLWAADSRDAETDPRWAEFWAILRAQNPAGIGDGSHWPVRLALALADATRAKVLHELAGDRFPFVAGIAKARLANPAPRASIPVVLRSLQGDGFPLPGWAYGPEGTQEDWIETLHDLKTRLEKGEITEAEVAVYIANLPEDWKETMEDEIRSELDNEADEDDPLLLARRTELLPENLERHAWAASNADAVVGEALERAGVLLKLRVHPGNDRRRAGRVAGPDRAPHPGAAGRRAGRPAGPPRRLGL